MKRWEYCRLIIEGYTLIIQTSDERKVLEPGEHDPVDFLHDTLDELGAQGWEMVSERVNVFWLKRPVPEA